MALTNMEEIVIKQEIEELVREKLSQANNNSGSCEENVSTSYSLPEKTQTLSFKVYFTHFEKELILALAKPHLKIIESKESNAVVKVEKAKVFREIARQFNNTHGVNPRTEKQIRQCYLNLKKKLRKTSTFSSPEQEETGGVEISKEHNLPRYHILAQPLPNHGLPLVLMPISTSRDSNNCSMEISKSQDKNTSTADIAYPPTPSNSSSNEASELDSSNLNCLDKEETPLQHQGSESEVPEPASVPAEAPAAKAPKENSSLRDILTRFRKKAKPQTAPSAAARAAACIEAEHVQSTLFMKKEEERKEQRAEADRREQELRMEHLRAKIKLTETKTLIHEKILELMDKNPRCVNLNMLKHVLSED